ncbi:MAG: hypothetical protein HOL51_19540 [Gemmatimonadetes bacterium]|jgi:hypothetical protein|nr:hypothetical protein [Gemmatimonadota bacterium]MDE0964129.1 hypothetical protein [Candidatus Latescibacterota bacterium]MBT5328309.1 hypothetical protein [Gemmatimonadota bacterium]MBT5451067.1 hypothetical protein [Gemmatimonadota bacterium]MBT5801998.1 hypothetical protein [Gemmatimonadota bacterium]
MPLFEHYCDLLDHIKTQGHATETLGRTPDGQPIVAIKSGGDKSPAIFISAGSHATEQAGVSAAVDLLDELDTEHQVYTLPDRDPIGMNGFSYALGLSLEAAPKINTLDEVGPFLREHGEVLYEKDDTVVAIIGEYGYSTHNLYYDLKGDEPWLEALKGRRLYFPNRDPGIEGTDFLQRAYALIVDPTGEVLHINRFHDTPWAPVESRCTRDLMATINPGLTLDLHEHGGDSFWFSARHQQNDDDQQWEENMADAMITAVAASGAALAPEEYLPGSFFTRGPRGVYWLNAGQRGEGLNLVDFAARTYGPSFTIETGMKLPFAERVATCKLVVKKAVEVFAQRYAG